jgi:hypothetical protein
VSKLFTTGSNCLIQWTIKLAWRRVSLSNVHQDWLGEAPVYPSVHFFTRQAARENLAAKQALTEAARLRHLALAENYQKRAEQLAAVGR